MSRERFDSEAEVCGANAAPYVLGALSEDESAAFLEHMESCAVCREEVASLQLVADALPAVAPQLTAPTTVKRRVMESVEGDAALAAAPAQQRQPRGSWLDPLRWRPLLGSALAAAAIVVVAIVIASSGAGSSGARVIRAEVLTPKASASLRVSAGQAQLDVSNMPQAAPGRVYQVWIKRGGAPQPTNALFTVNNEGQADVGVPGSVSGVKEVLVTSEPRGGSPAPTRSPVIIARLS